MSRCSSSLSMTIFWYRSSSSLEMPDVSGLYFDSGLSTGCLMISMTYDQRCNQNPLSHRHHSHHRDSTQLTFGTNINSMLRKQQKITASAMNANDASCCDAMTIATGAVMRHSTTTL